uniref:Uncharacterized protein n=1 Tax=Nelumbo nucifera TaxID=4432 RepID=A0A822ZMC4_NELNU|nr:TPA_asm: hypothetical protein HUJ06_004143 [Nelumbo nucifera]
MQHLPCNRIYQESIYRSLEVEKWIYLSAIFGKTRMLYHLVAVIIAIGSMH